MKILLSIILLLAVQLSSTQAQDTLVKPGGDSLLVIVLRSSFHNVKYTKYKKKKTHIISKTKLLKVLYHDGNIEYCVPKSRIYQVMNTNGWREVILTRDESHIKKSISLGQIYGSSSFIDKFTRTNELYSAEQDMRKQAYKMGASIVLIRGHITGRYLKLKGIAFR